MNDSGSWWCRDFSGLEEVQAGRFAIASTGADGDYLLRVTDMQMSPDERDYAVKRVGFLGVEVTSGLVFIGRGECLPGDGRACTPREISAADGRFIGIAVGEYDVEIFLIEWLSSSKYWSATSHRPETTPPDLVVLIRQRTRPFPGVHDSPRLIADDDTFLFPSTTREIGPKKGMVLETKVWKNRDGLTLRECGPLYYKPLLDDYSLVSWKDLVRVQVEEVDHSARTMRVRLLDVVRSA